MHANTIENFTLKMLAAAAIVALAAAAYLLTYLFVLIFASIVIAVILRTIAARVANIGVPDGLAVTTAVLLLLGGIALLMWLFGGLVTEQFMQLWQQLPQAMEAAQRQLGEWGISYDLGKLSQQAEGQMSGLLNRASGLVVAAGGVIADIVVVLAGAIFFAAQPRYYRDGTLRLMPPAVTDRVHDALGDCDRGLKQWLKAQILSSIAVATLSFLGFAVLGLPSSLALAIIAGALDFIPFAGPIIAAIPAVVIGVSQSPTTGLWVVILFLVIQQIQGNFLQPMVQKQSVDLPPVVLLFSVIAAGIVLGPPGVLLSAPLTVVGYILVQHFYIGAVLGREPKRPKRKEGNDRGNDALPARVS